MTREEIAKGRQKLINGVWGWLIAATIMLGAAALLGQNGQWCLVFVPLFLFLVCLSLVGICAYGLGVLHEQDELINERERIYKKVVK